MFEVAIEKTDLLFWKKNRLYNSNLSYKQFFKLVRSMKFNATVHRPMVGQFE